MSRKWLSEKEIKILRKSISEQEQLDRLYGRWEGIRNRAVIEVLLGTGLRASECRSIRLEDLSLNTKNGDSYLRVKTLKRRKPVTDVILLDKQLVSTLRDYLKELDLHGKSTDGSSYLFPGRYGGMMTLNTLEKICKRVFAKAGLPDYFSAHSLRHSHAFHVYQSSKNLMLVKSRLRHTSIQVSSIYIGFTEQEEQQALHSLYG